MAKNVPQTPAERERTRMNMWIENAKGMKKEDFEAKKKRWEALIGSLGGKKKKP